MLRIINNKVFTNNLPARGISVWNNNTVNPARTTYGELQLENYQQLKSLGFNFCHFSVMWGVYEPDINQLGVYDETRMLQLIKHINLAKQAGLDAVIAVRVQYDDADPKPWHGWGKHDAVNFRIDYPKLDPTITESTLPRYLNFLTWLLTNLNPIVGAFQPFHYPYHKSETSGWTEEDLRPRIEQLNNITIPAIAQHCRKLTNKLLIIDPIHEGQRTIFNIGAPYWVHPVPCGRYGPYHDREGRGWDTTDAPTPSQIGVDNIAYAFTCYENNRVAFGWTTAPWDYDPWWWRSGFEVGKNFQKIYNVPFIETEGCNIKIHGTTTTGLNCNERPIRQDRFDMWKQYLLDVIQWPNAFVVLEYAIRQNQPAEDQNPLSWVDNANVIPPILNSQMADTYKNLATPASPILSSLTPIAIGIIFLYAGTK